MSDVASRIADNVSKVRQRIADAAQRVGRQASDVTLVAVSKYVGADEIRALVETGCKDIGESRPQELWKKAEALGDLPIRWHMIGHVQRNKVARTLPICSLLHSIDSLRLIQAVNDECGESLRKTRVLLEVNVSGDETKHGFEPDEIESLLPTVASLTHVEVVGLMTMAARLGGEQRAREDFVRLRELRDQLANMCPPEVRLRELSMGMSGDYEVAIEEGATIVRVGSALFAND